MPRKKRVKKREPRESHSKIRYTTHGTPVIMERKIGDGLYLVRDMKHDGITIVAEDDLE